MRQPLSLRLSDEERAALKRAAAADKRTAASMARIILTDWLVANGFLKDERDG